MRTNEEIIRALMAAVSRDGSISPDRDPDEWSTLYDPDSNEERDSIAEAMGLRVYKSLSDQGYHVIPTSSRSIFALSRADAVDEMRKLASAGDEKEGRQPYMQAIWALIAVILIDWAFDRNLQPTCLDIDRPSVRSFMEEVDRRMRSAIAAHQNDEAAAPELIDIYINFMNRPDAIAPRTLETDRQATKTRAGAVNAVLRFFANHGYLIKEELDRNYIVPTPRFCAVYQFGIASKSKTLDTLLAFISDKEENHG